MSPPTSPSPTPSPPNDDPSLDAASPPAATTSEAPSDGAEPEGAVASEGSGDEQEAAEGPLSPTQRYRQALDLYLEGKLLESKREAEELLASGEEGMEDLRPRVERLRRRALDRIEREGIDEEPLEGADEVAPEGAAGEDQGAEPREAPEGEVATDGPAEADGAAEAGSAAGEAEAPAGEAAAEGAPELVEAAAEAPTTEPAAETPATEAADGAAADAPAAEGTPSSGAAEGAAPGAEGEAPGAEGEAAASEVAEQPTEEAASDVGEVIGGEAEEDDASNEQPEVASEPARPKAPPRPPRPEGSDVGSLDDERSPESDVGPVEPSAEARSASARLRVKGATPRQPRRAPPRRPGAPAPPPANAAQVERLSGAVERLGKQVRGMEGNLVRIAEAYQRVVRDGKRKDQAYDQLYEELRQYKDNFLLAAQKPLFKDVILLFDGLARTMRKFEEAEEEQIPRQEVIEALDHLKDEVLEVLYRRDIELIEDRPDKLDISIQKPVRRIETDDPDQDRAIDQVVREGFRMNGVVLRPQEVIVKRCLKERETK